MILSNEATDILSRLLDWGTRNGVRREADDAVAFTVSRIVGAQLSGTVGQDTDAAKLIVSEVLEWADRRGHGARARGAIKELGLGEHIPATHGLFDVSFAGITLRLTLPLRRDGSPYGVPETVAQALESATVTPVPTEASEPQEAAEAVFVEENGVTWRDRTKEARNAVADEAVEVSRDGGATG